MVHPHNLPIMIVLVPLLTAVVTPMFGNRRREIPWLLALAATAMSFVCCIEALRRVMDPAGPGFLSYAIGNWRPPWGIEYRIDAANAFVLVVVSAIAFVVTAFARRSIDKEIPHDRHHFFYAVWLLCITGLLGITITGDAFNVYVLLEISSLTTYTLVAMGRSNNRRALPAAMNYLVLGTIGASFILLGIGYLYMVTGTLNMADMARILADDSVRAQYSTTIVVAAAFLTIGFAIKVALFPLHTWLPDAYSYAPSAVSALLAATATKVSAYVAIRFLYTILGPDLSFTRLHSHWFLLLFAGLAIVIGSLIAIRQTDVKRLLAYSSVAQIGYIVLGFSLVGDPQAQVNGLTGSLIHIFNHALTKGGMFLALACVAWRLGGTSLDDLRGLGRRMPLTCAAFVVGGLGLIGVPLTAGFVSKWYLVSGAFGVGHIGIAFVVLVGSLLAIVYVWRVVEAMYFGTPQTDASREAKEVPLTMLVPVWILIGASVWFGIDATLTGSVAEEAARGLMNLAGGVPAPVSLVSP